MAHDTDLFNKWNAIQLMMTSSILDVQNGAHKLSEIFLTSFEKLVDAASSDPYFYAFALAWPSESQLNDELTICDFEGISRARAFVKKELSIKYFDKFSSIFESIEAASEYKTDNISIIEKAHPICTVEPT